MCSARTLTVGCCAVHNTAGTTLLVALRGDWQCTQPSQHTPVWRRAAPAGPVTACARTLLVVFHGDWGRLEAGHHASRHAAEEAAAPRVWRQQQRRRVVVRVEAAAAHQCGPRQHTADLEQLVQPPCLARRSTRASSLMVHLPHHASTHPFQQAADSLRLCPCCCHTESHLDRTLDLQAQHSQSLEHSRCF